MTEERTIFSIMSDIEDQSIYLERARTVLLEAAYYVEDKIAPDTWEARYFIQHTLPTMDTLLNTVNWILAEIGPALDEAAKELMDIHNMQKGI